MAVTVGTVVDNLVLGVAVLLWATVVYQSLHVRRQPNDTAVRTLGFTFVALAVAATFFIPAVHLASGRLVGVTNIGDPIARSAVLLAAFAAQLLLLQLTVPAGPSARARGWRWCVLIVTMLTLWALFALAPVGTATGIFTRGFGASPYVIAYLAVFLVYLAFALVDVIRQCRRYGAAATGSVASGLRLIALGCLFGLGYVTTKVIFLLALAAGPPDDGLIESVLTRSLAVAAGVLVAAGCTAPAVGSILGQARSWLRAYVAHQRLYPLWAALYSVTPEIALDPASSRLRDSLRLRDLAFRLYRRVIEIRDGRLALRPFLDEVVARDATRTAMRRGLRGDEAAAASEAAVLAAAVQAHRASARTEHPLPWSGTGASSYTDEVVWLVRVARHFAAVSSGGPSLTAPASATAGTQAS